MQHTIFPWKQSSVSQENKFLILIFEFLFDLAALDKSNGSQSDIPGFLHWSGCVNYDETRVSFIQLMISFTGIKNMSSPSKCRVVKVFLKYRDFTLDESWF